MNDKIKEFFERINLKKKFPNYFKSSVPFQIGFILFLFVFGINFYLNGYSFYDLSVSCPYDFKECVNPFYQCTIKERKCAEDVSFIKSEPLFEGLTDIYISDCVKQDTNLICATFPSYFCDKVPCDKKYIDGGESFGRTDFLHEHSNAVYFLLFILPFIINHIYYTIRTVKK